jgi:hypothetical protein
MPLRTDVICLLFAALLLGLAQIGLLPPWEGFDETAHYSYIQQFAETGQWPRFGDAQSKEVEDYLKVAPGAASLQARWSYREFFASPAAVIEAGRNAAHSPRDLSSRWQGGVVANWEAQHPPLYYVLMTPAYLVSRTWSIAGQLFFLRTLSYLLAWLGLCLATASTFRDPHGVPKMSPAIFIVPGLWAYFFPMWFPAMARLGNDSLVCLLAAFAFVLSKRLFVRDSGLVRYASLGAICGLGLLTKVTFLPLVVALSFVLAVRAWQGRAAAECARSRWFGLIVLLIVAALTSGWWYVDKWIETGDLLASYDAIALRQHGGLISGLLQNPRLETLIHGIPVLVATFLWGGTWSLTEPPLIALVPLFLILVLQALGYLRSLRDHALTPIEWLAFLTATGLVVGLIQHLLIYVAIGEGSAVAGWYPHSFAPVLFVMLGRSLSGLGVAHILRRAILVLMLYPLLFLPFAEFVEAQALSGCLDKIAGQAFFYNVLARGECAANITTIWNRLSILTFPAVTAGLFAVGWLSMLCGVLTAARNGFRRPQADLQCNDRQ